MAKDRPHDAATGSIDSASRAGTDVAEGARPLARPPALALVEALSSAFVEAVSRALKIRLDGSTTSLAIVDHYLSLSRHEQREPIVSLLAAEAGAYFGELVREQIGGTWVGDGVDPRRLRLLLEPQLVYFSPVDQAYEAIAGESLDPDDPRIAAGPPFDSAFGLAPVPDDADDDTPLDGPADDTRWLHERLAELPPVPEDHFHSLTCRFETLQVMLELLAAKHVSEGREPKRLGVGDYVEILARS